MSVVKSCRLWYTDHFRSADRVVRFFAYLVAANFAMSFLYIVLNPDGVFGLFGAPLCTLWSVAIIALTVAYVHGIDRSNQLQTSGSGGASGYPSYSPSLKWLEGVRLALFLLLGTSVLVFFDGANIVNRVRYKQLADGPAQALSTAPASTSSPFLWDEELLELDEFLLGWIFPHGQLALWLDSETGGEQWGVGPTTTAGRLIAEVLQIFYASYYVWGNALLLYLAKNYFWDVYVGVVPVANSSNSSGGNASHDIEGAGTRSRSGSTTSVSSGTGPEGIESPLLEGHPSSAPQQQSMAAVPAHRKRMQWRRLQMFLCGWVLTYYLNFLGNLMFPAVSPRIWLQNFYEHPVEGYWFMNFIRGAIGKAAANTFSAFPSGHCGMSWLATLLAYRMGFVFYSKLAGVAAGLITIATMWLRYHYFVDFLFSLPLVAWGVWVGGLDTEILFQSSLYPELFEGASHHHQQHHHHHHHSQHQHNKYAARGGGLGQNYPYQSTSGGSGGGGGGGSTTTSSGGHTMAPAAVGATVLLGHSHNSDYFDHHHSTGSGNASDDETGSVSDHSTTNTETGSGRRYGPVVLLGHDDHHPHNSGSGHHSHSGVATTHASQTTNTTDPASNLKLSLSASMSSLSAAKRSAVPHHELDDVSSGTPTAHAVISGSSSRPMGSGGAGGVAGSRTPHVTHSLTEVVLE